MKSVKPWVKALGVSQDDYQRWCEEMPPNVSVTHWCLKEGRISAGAYLQWASEHYGLTVLRPEFFENAPNKALFKTMSSVANWSAEMIPIHEWDGTVFIACVEPAEDAHWSFPVCYVLASSSELGAYWQSLHEETKVVEEVSELATFGPYPTNPGVPVPTVAPPPIAKPVASKPPPVATPPPPPEVTSETKILDGPGGLNLNLTVTGANKDKDLFSELASQVTTEDEIPTQVKSSPPADGDAMPDGLKLNFNAATPPPPEQTFTAIKIDMPVATSVDKTGSVDKTSSVEKTSTVASAMSDQGKVFGDQFFRDTQAQFEGAMILVHENNRLNPWSWDAGFAPPSHQGPSVDLSKPSAFRIAFRTRMPYLGHVVETPTNMEFFNGWGYTQMPESIIAHPLGDKTAFHGVLLLKAKKSQKQTHLLSSSEQFAQRISHALAQMKVKAA